MSALLATAHRHLRVAPAAESAGAVTRSHLGDGRCVGWYGPPVPGWRVAIDAERADVPVPPALARSFGATDFWARWTRLGASRQTHRHPGGHLVASTRPVRAPPGPPGGGAPCPWPTSPSPSPSLPRSPRPRLSDMRGWAFFCSVPSRRTRHLVVCARDAATRGLSGPGYPDMPQARAAHRAGYPGMLQLASTRSARAPRHAATRAARDPRDNITRRIGRAWISPPPIAGLSYRDSHASESTASLLLGLPPSARTT